MANPEQGQSPLSQGTGSWLDFDLAIPDFLAPVREAIDNVAQLLIAILNVLLAILDVIKAFTSAFLDPLIAIIEILIALIERFVNDLRNAGFYLHGDWHLLKDGPEFRNLLGGFQAFERRMIQRLIDPTDPNRPDLSPFSVVIALFFYVSADATTLMRLLNFIRGILALFGRGGNFRMRALGTVTNVQVTYGFDGVSENVLGATKTLFSSMVARKDGTDGINQIGDPNIATIKWQLADPPGNFLSPVSRLVPDNFLIEVSTEANPLFLQYDIVPAGKQSVSRDPIGAEQAPGRIRGLVVDEQGRTLQVTGGEDQFQLSGGTFFFDKYGSPPRSDPRVFAFKSAADAGPIPLGAKGFKHAGRAVLQKTFFFKGVQVGGITPGQFMSATLKLDDMPRRATHKANGDVDKSEETDTFYVRVRAVSRSVTEQTPLKFLINNGMFGTQRLPIIATIAQTGGSDKLSLMDRGEASRAVKMTFPNANTAAYLECVLAALYVLVLSRPDLQALLDEEGNPKEFDPDDAWSIYDNKVQTLTGLEAVAKKLLPQITGRKFDNSKFYTSESLPLKWRKKIFLRCSALVNRMYEANSPPSSVQGLVVEVCQPLLDFKLGGFASDADSPVAADQLAKGVVSGPTPFQSVNPGADPELAAESADAASGPGLPSLTLIEAMQDKNEFGGIASNPSSVGTEDTDRQDTRRDLRADIASGELPFSYEPSFYSTNNDAFIANSDVSKAQQAQIAFIQNQIETLNEGGVLVNVDAELILDSIDGDTDAQISTLKQRQSSLQQVTLTGTPPRVLKGSVTQAPVIYVRRNRRITKLTYARNAFTPEIYNAAALALQIAAGPVIDSDGGWITARLGQLIPDIDTFLDEILAWIKALAAAIDSIAKAIKRFIEYLQARIIELQMLIQRINAILQNLFRLFDILPSGAILPIVSKGTSGVLTDLVTAQNKPFDSASAYGGGAVVLASAGPLFPSFFLDIFAGGD